MVERTPARQAEDGASGPSGPERSPVAVPVV